jgi:hypothetical protein
MAEWAVIPAPERDATIEATRRHTVRATVSVSVPKLRQWARQQGMHWPVYNYTTVIDAYVEAQYRADRHSEDNTHD